MRRLLASVRPTSRGWQALAAAAISLAAALSLGTTQFYQLAYALLGLMVAALVIGRAASRRLGVERSMSLEEGMAAGEPVEFGLKLTNGSRISTSGLAVADRLPERRVLEAPCVPASGERLVQTTVSFARRGLYELGPAELSCTDPLGLLRFRREAGGRAEALVYPEVRELNALPVRGAEEASGRGSLAARGEDLSGLREYRWGDDRRLIHWKSVARTGDLMVKEFDPDAPRRYTVMLGLEGGRAAEHRADREFEDAVSAAASIFAHLQGRRLSPSLRLPDGSFTEFSAGESGRRRAMRLLATAQPGGAESLDHELRQENSAGRLGEGVVLIQRADSFPEALPEAVSEVRARGVFVLVALLASHTYRPGGEGLRREQETALLARAQRLEDAGAAVRIIRRETGAAHLLVPAGPRAGEAG